MKKTLAALAALTMAITPVACADTALAPKIDISELTLDELVALHEDVDARIKELTECDVDADVIYVGDYEVGKDIAAGTYRFICNKTSDSGYDFYYYLYADRDAVKDWNPIQRDGGDNGDVFQLRLEDGMILRVDNGQALVQKAAKASWAP